jgi:ribosomal protein L21
MYAIIETGGKQYRVETGTLVQVESLPGEVGGTVEIGQVRLVHGEKGLEVGLHHDLQETTAQELSANEWPSPGLYQIAHYRY